MQIRVFVINADVNKVTLPYNQGVKISIEATELKILLGLLHQHMETHPHTHTATNTNTFLRDGH